MSYHPADTNQAIGSLPVDRFEHWHYRVNLFQISNHREQKSEKVMKKLHKEVLISPRGKEVLQQLKDNWQQAIGVLSQYRQVVVLEGQLAGQMVHGLGAPHVRETAITIHPVYGVPYLPASSIKGVVRNWALQAFFQGRLEQVEQARNTKTGNQHDAAAVFDYFFGTQEGQGAAHFFDAYPSGEPKLSPDVMTVHFKDYYTGNNPPTDNQNTNPISFYTLAPVKFRFIFTLNKQSLTIGENKLSEEQLVKLLTTWLEKALQEQGIGSKTRLGYGAFIKLADITSQWLDGYKQQIKQQTPKQQQEADKKVTTSPTANAATQESSPEHASPKDELMWQIGKLTDKQDDQANSKAQIFNQVLELGKAGDKEPAMALKAYWEKTGNWKDNPNKANKDKQVKKTIQLKELLDN